MQPSRQKILVIDDSKPIQMLIRARLGDEPVDLHFANDATTGLVSAAELMPDLILLDVDLPDASGFEVCTRLKADVRTMHVPIIFLTGATGTDEKIRGLDMGAVDYVTKPFEPAELRARVRASLRTKFLMDLLAKKAQIDGLTGLWNRAYFDSRLTQEATLLSRTGTPLAVVLLDVDHFKSINDRFGHPFGDTVLRAVAQAAVDVARTTDVVCRYGGEEFAIIAPNTGHEGATMLAERVRSRIEQMELSHRGSPLRVTASLGLSTVQPGAPLPAVAAADAAMYHAKQKGRNRVETNPMTPEQVAPSAA